jgi:hypothetical protein
MKSYRSSKLLKYAGTGMTDGIDGRFVSRLVQTTNRRYVVGNLETEICFQTLLFNRRKACPWWWLATMSSDSECKLV